VPSRIASVVKILVFIARKPTTGLLTYRSVIEVDTNSCKKKKF